MGGCSAPNCNNSSKKGYTMKVFPRDPERRAKWAANVGRQYWKPTNFSCLCEVHFEPTMWEKRNDGLKKLKCNAVPTIFGFYLKKQSNEKNERSNNRSNLNQEQSRTDYIQNNLQADSEAIKKSEINPGCDDINVTVIERNTDQLFEMQSITENTSYSQQKSTQKDKITVLQKCEECKSLLDKQAVEIMMLRKRLKKMRDAFRKVKRESDKNLYKTQLKRIFTDDQIHALLTNSKRVRHWSNDTIRKALRLKFACGERGYKELIKQNIPLPSIQMLQVFK
ncbi:THAP domain-containing protein 2-like isoform X2 [Pogonomyrmex barbatus]|uniref:THAP domain-containing protein 2-like isoform X2 n=1 Tax=Pogonomyrmex barbatus TaxID=144034 RepID=A0A8N1S624_9HYME|nr:THAP domain-containing protein 2-like isoform X2 [Pogonomyrmex barbatus]